MTNAHVVYHSTNLRVRRHGEAELFEAKLSSIAHELDLALLTVDDENFWKGGSEPLEFDSTPQLQANILSIGYPSGGDQICVTSGVVSRLHYGMYSHASNNCIMVQIDAAINPGASGGPCLSTNGKCVGVAFQAITSNSLTGYIIPSVVVKRYLDDIDRHGKFPGLCGAGLFYQGLENVFQREHYGLPKSVTGVLIRDAAPFGTFGGIVRKGDILTHIGDYAVACDGTVEWRTNERVPFGLPLSLSPVGSKMKVSFFRDGHFHHVHITTQVERLRVPLAFDTRPRYVLYGGVVFIRLTAQYLMEYADSDNGDWFNRAPRELVAEVSKHYEGDGKEVVVVCNVLEDKANHGYGVFISSRVSKVNGTPVMNLAHLHSLLHTTESHKEIEVHGTATEWTMLFKHEEALQATVTVQRQYNIPGPHVLDEVPV